MRSSVVLVSALLLGACTTSEPEPGPYDPIQLGGKTDMPWSGGDFTFSLEDLASGELSISGLRCPAGEICDFTFGLGLDDDVDQTPAERAVREYNMLVDAEYLDAGAQRTSRSERVTLRDTGSGYGLLGGTFQVAGTQVKYTIRPDIDVDLSGPSISLEGIRFRGSIDLCGGLPCSW